MRPEPTAFSKIALREAAAAHAHPPTHTMTEGIPRSATKLVATAARTRLLWPSSVADARAHHRGGPCIEFAHHTHAHVTRDACGCVRTWLSHDGMHAEAHTTPRSLRSYISRRRQAPTSRCRRPRKRGARARANGKFSSRASLPPQASNARPHSLLAIPSPPCCFAPAFPARPPVAPPLAAAPRRRTTGHRHHSDSCR